MHCYFVTAVGQRSITLHDSAGRFHRVRATGVVPEVGTPLLGSLPGLGFRVLLCPAADRMFRVIFEELDCAPARIRKSC
jgi:hypothetical protein